MTSPVTAETAVELFRRPPERFVAVGGGEVAVRSVGEGPDVLLVHGWPVSGATFRRLLPHLAGRVRCHVVDLPGAGDSRFGPGTTISATGHVEAIRAVVDQLGLEDVAVVGHDSGGLFARHAFAGDPRVRAFGLVDTEQPQGITWRFRAFLLARHLPALAPALRLALGDRRVRRHPLVLGGAFADRDLLDGEFDEFFLRPLREDRRRLDAAVRLLRSFEPRLVHELDDAHRRIRVPVQLVWGEHDLFFPVGRAREMAASFADAELAVVPAAGLFSHEEQPAAVAAALLPALVRSA